MKRVGEHPVVAGPLSVRWLAYELGPVRAGALGAGRVLVENAGSATWRSRGGEGVQLAYHWLDPLGNPVIWDGVRSPLPRPVAPGATAELTFALVAPRPPGRYRLALEFVEEHRFWFAELGIEPLTLDVDVGPRIEGRRLAVVVHGGADPTTTAALAAQEEQLAGDPDTADALAHLVAGAAPAPDWARRTLDAHAEGWAAVGPAIDTTGGAFGLRRARALAPWRPAGGRNPSFSQPLLLPSLLRGLEPTEEAGLPAYAGADALFDARIVVRLRPRSGRPHG
jgi:hypothetical protein